VLAANTEQVVVSLLLVNMPEIDLERLLKEPIYASDFQLMIGDVEDFLDFSEINIEWQYRRELQSIRRADLEGFPPEYRDGYREHLEANAEHRFKVTLPLRVRYGALLALTTSVEWSVQYLVKWLRQSISKKPEGHNCTVHALFELEKRTGIGKAGIVRDYKALVQIRNCIAHSAGIEKHDQHRRQLPAAVNRLAGFSLGNWHFFGQHICIEKRALNPYIDAMGELVVTLNKAAHEQNLLRNDT
jgi:hypothetical protein